jgi:iron-sulfur cluster assembly protein
MTTITLTDRAAGRLRHLLADAGEDRYGLRIGVDSFGWTQRYRLSLGPGPHRGEDTVHVDDLAVYFDADCGSLVDGVRIDYVETAASAGFTFHQPRPAPAPPPGMAVPARRPLPPTASAGPVPPDGVDGAVWRQVEAALDDIRPHLWRDGGDLAVVAVDGGTAWVRLTGACLGCSAAQATMIGVIEQRLTAVDGIDHVRLAP